MGTWSSYTLSDFLLFSLQTYERLFELHNAALWPTQLIAVAAGTVVFYLHLKPKLSGERVLFGTLALLWIWIAWSFFWQRYQPINFAAAYVAPLFVVQGCILGLIAFRPLERFRQSPTSLNWMVRVLLLIALIGYPLLGLSRGRSWLGVEYFGLMPDPTALATIALLALYRGPLIGLAQIIPVLWCVLTGLTLWGLGSNLFFIAPVGMIIVMAALVGLRRSN